ncbi:TetR/AcrR family transcriptional regulator [Nocardia sp. NPDC004415]
MDPIPTVAHFAKGRVPREVRRKQLLALAEALLVEHGYDGFSIEDLCQAAGVSRPVVYEHFGSKERVYLAVLRSVREEFGRTMFDTLATANDVQAAARAGSDAFFAILEKNPRRWLMVFGSTTGFSGALADDLWELRSSTVNAIAMMLSRFYGELSPVHLAALAHGISGAGEGLGRWWMRNRDVPRQWVVDQHVTMTLAAVEAVQIGEEYP